MCDPRRPPSRGDSRDLRQRHVHRLGAPEAHRDRHLPRLPQDDRFGGAGLRVRGDADVDALRCGHLRAGARAARLRREAALPRSCRQHEARRSRQEAEPREPGRLSPPVHRDLPGNPAARPSGRDRRGLPHQRKRIRGGGGPTEERPHMACEEVGRGRLPARLRFARGRSDELHRRAARAGPRRAPAPDLLQRRRGRGVRHLPLPRRRQRPAGDELERQQLPEDEHDDGGVWDPGEDRRRSAGVQDLPAFGRRVRAVSGRLDHSLHHRPPAAGRLLSPGGRVLGADRRVHRCRGAWHRRARELLRERL